MVNGVSCSQNGQLITTVGADSTLKHWKLYCADVDSSQVSNDINLRADTNEEPVFMSTTKMPITCVHHQQTKVLSKSTKVRQIYAGCETPALNCFWSWHSHSYVSLKSFHSCILSPCL